MRKFLTRPNLLRYGGYVGFFAACFVLFAYLTFPYDRVKSVLEQRLSQSSAGVDTKLSIGELGPHWLTGVALHDVAYERKSAGDTAPVKLGLDALQLSVSPLSLLSGVSVDFGAEVGGGDIDGSYASGDGEPVHIEAELDAVDLRKLGLGAFVGLPMQGSASGDIDVTLAERPAETQGAANLTIDGLQLADGKTPIKVPGMGGGLTLPPIDAGKLDFKLAIREGVATIERMESKGKDLELTGSGSVRLVNPLSQSRADIVLSVKVAEAYKQRNAKTSGMFSLMEQSVPAAMSPDGSMRFRLTGPIGALRAIPGGGGGPTGRPTKRGTKVKGPD